MTPDTEKAAEYLAENPRMIGVLFTIGTLVSQTGMAIATDSAAGGGP